MAKNLVFLVLWFVLTPLLLISTIFYSTKQNASQNLLDVYPSISANEFEINNDIEGQVLSTQINDLRPYIVSRFL